jgi:hypothetical protein
MDLLLICYVDSDDYIPSSVLDMYIKHYSILSNTVAHVNQ